MTFSLSSLPKLALLCGGVLLFSACNPVQKQSSQLKSGSETILSKLATPSAAPKAPSMKEYKQLADFKPNSATIATLVTTKGDITIELFTKDVPLTTANFLDLASSGFYDGVIFHRVIPDFMAQVGDPLTKEPGSEGRWGTGGPDYKIMDEFSDKLTHSGPGVVSMANSGPNSGGSQFFITHVATPWLDGKHAVFGQVTAGLDVLMEIDKGDQILKINLK